MTDSTKPQPAEVTRERALKLARDLSGSDVAPNSWRVEVVASLLYDTFTSGQRSRDAEVERLSEERLRYQQERDHYRALHLNASQDDARALRAKQELLSEIFDSVAEQAGHRGCARGYEYNSVLLLIRDRITAALARGGK